MFSNAKWRQIAALIPPSSNVLVAYSGGVDSALLAYFLRQEIGHRVLAVTCTSELLPEQEKATAIDFARTHDIPHRLVSFDDLAQPQVRHNTRQRCYYCKYSRFKYLLRLAQEENFAMVFDGSNMDDLKEYRPGLRALQELGILSPYIRVGIHKSDIRHTAAFYQLSVADKPAAPCLATRIPYNEELTPDKLQRIAQAERILFPYTGSPLRVRTIDSCATIACIPTRWQMLSAEIQQCLLNQLYSLGFTHIDITSYTSGIYDTSIDK